MSILGIYNIKGGVGKTATAVNLAYLSSQQGQKTLLCDLDPQGSASYYFRIRSPKKFNTKKLLKGGTHIEKNIRGTDFPNLDLLPADFSYRNIDIALDELKQSQVRLHSVLKPLLKEYDRILLDCPPNLTLLAENIFYAADKIVVPIIPTTLSLMSLKQLFKFMEKIGQSRKKAVVMFSMVERRKKMHQELMNAMQKRQGVIQTPVPFLADIERMGIYRKPVTAALPKSNAAKAYVNVWNELKVYI